MGIYLKLIDSHCHFDFPEFDDARQSIWENAKRCGIQSLIIPSVSPQYWDRASRIAQHFSGIYWAAGLHPWWCETYYQSSQLTELEFLLRSAITNSNCVAVGETGLDAIKGGALDLQKQSLDIHLQLATSFSKPIILHAHKTQPELFLQVKPFKQLRGVVHAFSGSYEQAKQWVDAGFYLGVGGVITYERANKTRQAIKNIPLDAILLETDAPSMPLAGEQGKINTPLHLTAVAKCLADLKQESIEAIASITTKNATELFGLRHAV